MKLFRNGCLFALVKLWKGLFIFGSLYHRMNWLGLLHMWALAHKPLQTLKMVGIDPSVKISVLNLYIFFQECSVEFLDFKKQGKMYKIYRNWQVNGIILSWKHYIEGPTHFQSNPNQQFSTIKFLNSSLWELIKIYSLLYILHNG